MRMALGVEYDGTAYIGWQRQKLGIGVQECLETAIGRVADEVIGTICAGRTDAGVHATGQVVHFDTIAERSERGWLLGINSNLPDDINVNWIARVDDDFHARYSATSRTYRYIILNSKVRSSLDRHRSWWVHKSLNEQAMQQGADLLLGEHDFSAFRAAGCRAATATRDITQMKVLRKNCWILIEVTANAFLQHMVRNIVGTLVAIGSETQKPQWTSAVLDSGDRTQAGISAPPQGLTLVNVSYVGSYSALPTNRDTSGINLYDAVL